MPCDTRLKQGQTIKGRAEEVRKVAELAAAGLASGKVKAKVGPQGGVVFTGLAEDERDGVTDACVYRRVMATGSALAKAAIARAEALSGRTVNKQALAQGVHSHDGGRHWHHGH